MLERPSDEFTSGGYFRFPGGNPSTRQEAEELLRNAGFIQTCPVDYVARAILDDEVPAKFPKAELILQVYQTDLFAGAYRVWPPLSPHDKRDFVEKTFVGCSREGDFFMIRNHS